MREGFAARIAGRRRAAVGPTLRSKCGAGHNDRGKDCLCIPGGCLAPVACCDFGLDIDPPGNFKPKTRVSTDIGTKKRTSIRGSRTAAGAAPFTVEESMPGRFAAGLLIIISFGVLCLWTNPAQSRFGGGGSSRIYA
jgi:hypothetical protein